MKKNITAKQFKGINAILSSSSIIEAARTSGIHERTLRRWLVDPAFKVALKEAQGEVIQGTARALLTSELKAVASLNELLHNPTLPGANIKLHTSVAILQLSCHYSERAYIEERLAKIEEVIGNEDNQEKA